MSYPRRNLANRSGVYPDSSDAFYTYSSNIALPPLSDFPGDNHDRNTPYPLSSSFAGPQTASLGLSRPLGYSLTPDSHPSSHHRPTLGGGASDLPLYSQPQPARHPQSAGSHHNRSAHTIQPTRSVLHSHRHHPSEPGIPQHPWATPETTTDPPVQPRHTPLPTLDVADQSHNHTMNTDPWKPTSDELCGLPVIIGSSVPARYDPPLQQPHLSTTLSASRHQLSREFDLGTRRKTYSEPNAPSTSAPRFEASAEDVYVHSYDPIIPPSPSTRLEPNSFRADSGFTTTPFLPQRLAPLPSEPSTQSSHASTHSHSRSSHIATSNPHPEWAMWVGNVPADASQEELFQFFNQPRQHPPPEDDGDPSPSVPSRSPISGGVTSVFIISHSNCAFVNFESQLQLDSAVTTFNGCRLRANHSPGSRLVCRACRPEDYGDGHAGVTRQRRSGVHVKWVRDRRKQVEQSRTSAVLGYSRNSKQALSTSRPVTVEDISLQLRSLSQVAKTSSRTPKQDDVPPDPGSPTSTTSSLLAEYFPQRYFILKSSTQSDLDQSIRTGLWATQPHNEDILNGAYRTSQDVFLIFGVNRSGEFYGYVRMAGLIESIPTPFDGSSSEAHVSGDADITHDHLLPSPRYRTTSPELVSDDERDERGITRRHVSVSGHQPSSYSDERNIRTPAELGPPRQLVSPNNAHSSHTKMSTSNWVNLTASSQNYLGPHRPYADTTHERAAGETREREDAHSPTNTTVLGRPFQVEWIKTDKLPFLRTRHLRNPWNYDRQIKVARDGTELDPDIARQLFEEWDKPPVSVPSSKTNTRSNTKPHAIQSFRH